MCLGLPLQVVGATEDGGTGRALCRSRDGAERQVDLALVGAQPAGTWLLVHIDTALAVLDAETAEQVADALAAAAAVMTGQPVDHLFADLTGREPQLPDFLREATP